MEREYHITISSKQICSRAANCIRLCYVDGRTGALGEKYKMKKVLVVLIFCISTLLLSCVTNSPVKKDLFNNLKISILKIQKVTH